MSEHRRACPDEVVRCPLCALLLRRGSLEAHQEDPTLAVTHMMAMEKRFEQRFQELQDQNHKLEKRLTIVTAVTTSAKDRLIEELRAVSTVQPIRENASLAWAIQGLVGEEVWAELQEGRDPTTICLLAGLLSIVASRPEEFWFADDSLMSAIMAALAKLTERAQDQLLESGLQELISAVVVTLRAFLCDPDIQRDGCWVVNNLALTDNNRHRLQRHGACQAVLTALQTFPGDLGVQHAACRAVSFLGCSKDIAFSLADSGACLLLMKALRMSASRADEISTSVDGKGRSSLSEVHAAASRAAGCLSFASSQCKDFFGEHGAFKAIVTMMRRFSSKAKVQVDGFLGIHGLTLDSCHNRKRFLQGGSLDVILAALRRFRSMEFLPRHGCLIIWQLAQDSEARNTLGQAGACVDVLSAVRKFSSNEMTQWAGCLAMRWLAESNPDNQLKLHRGGALQLICAALRRFPEHSGIQESAKQAANKIRPDRGAAHDMS